MGETMTTTIKLDTEKLLGYVETTKLAGAKVGFPKRAETKATNPIKRSGAKVGGFKQIKRLPS